MEEKECLECGTKIFGRADKKFCSDLCRNAYNNKLNSDSNNYIRSVNATLKKNRKILNQLNPNGKSKTHRDRLVEKGFDFNYYTNTYTTKAGAIYYFCYEYGYLPLDNNFFALVKRDS
ncbi:DUF2116 family Zn-ribbon domain-containing protein [Fulvivirga ligni]|uniref:DUF2116 family Zn-ribbon domain-containing protein n=1 Tax=Fulvivirga ligni TaxID=2904246 RepID=UPI001F36F3EC|nr:DUF2116 family Zn-ribbon domain-containing protein [Fulvivirga ligni]UII20348.1 DUF2116 family Zn-ribbon domain-containing protein [Fulvivirga ligni]